MQPDRPQTTRLDEPKDDQDRAAWEPPTFRAVGTIAELVQQTKRSGKQDCGGTKRFGTGFSCT
jgi:hypothetical protein